MLSAVEETPLIGPRTPSFSSSGSGLLQILLYHHPNSARGSPETDGSLSFPFGEYTAEELCVAAATACGILPACHPLFSLATEDLAHWFAPSHIFTVDESSRQTVVYRLRFRFPDWFGPRKSYRMSPSGGHFQPILDQASLDYLFAQSRSDFLGQRLEVSWTLEAQETGLSLAVLDMLRMAKERRQPLRQLFRSVSYKSCLPEGLRSQVQVQHFLTRKRIRRQFGRSLCRVGRLPADLGFLKMKYLLELASLAGPVAIEETFLARVPGQAAPGATRLVHVSAEKGILSSHPGGASQGPNLFCDYPDIADIAMQQASREGSPVENRVVSVTRTDGRALELEFPGLPEALSFVSLVDGYYRLTVDSCHYFCKEVTPPRLLEDLENQCHGPITSEFAAVRLEAAAGRQPVFLLRRSPEDFTSDLLTLCLEDPPGRKKVKSLLIQRTWEGAFSTPGVAKTFCSLRELVRACQQFTLQVDGVDVRLGTLCPPKPKEKSNLLIMRGGSRHQLPASPLAPRRCAIQVSFHKVQVEHLVQGEHLGSGTFTGVYRGLRRDPKGAGEEEEEEEEEEGQGTERSHEAEVALKVLEPRHSRWVEPFLEAASLVGQLSHKHLVLLHGVSMGPEWVTMVQEFVPLGPLDTYLRRSPPAGQVAASWKLQVAKQLAYALNFLEDKRTVHGSVSAKKVLLVREGDPRARQPPFVKLSSPGVSPTALSGDLLVDRIPWVAPEGLQDPTSLAPESDRWGFGATLWQIFNGGHMPLSTMEPKAKLQFYQEGRQLPPLPWAELAELVAQCMDYDPQRRPSFRAILRDFNGIISSDYELLLDTQVTCSFGGYPDMAVGQDPTLFEDRHLKYLAVLGKGNFGSVELCRYDPLGDGSGELVAVKRLQQSTPEQRQAFQKEVGILRALHHDHIVAYRGVCYSHGRQCLRLVMEYLPHGCLRDYLQKNHGRLDHRRLLLYAWQVCQGMDYLGAERYIHRDLAARNILVESESRVKIGDFGLARLLPQGKDYYVVREPGQSPIFWYAPESLANSLFSQESDVWSFGVVLYELFTYGSKTQSPSEEFLRMMGYENPPSIAALLLELLKQNQRLPTPAGCPIEVFTLMQSCWSFAPGQRPPFGKLASQIEALRNSYCNNWG